MTSYASGKYAWSICDTCGFRYPYLEMQKTSYDAVVCPDCYDGSYDLKNHPQNKSPPIVPDPMVLKDPRPDTNLDPNQYDDDQETPLQPGQVPA